jgi:hypothetical protein
LSSLPVELSKSAGQALAGLDRWFQTMRGPGGFGGPVAHWWESSWLYCGPMVDWRYEGILCGYVTLYRRTGEAAWLDRAVQAGEDAVQALLPTGNFRNSAFQQGPMEGGTPHEAAVDVGLFELAALLKENSDPRWERYFQAAQKNILLYQIGRLWNGSGFLDQPWNQTLVPNKNGTLIETLTFYETLSGEDMSRYIQGAANVILSAQEKNGPRAGGIVHLGTGRHRLAIGIYNARSVCGLLQAYRRDPHEEYLSAAAGSLKFMRGLLAEDGVCFGRYPDGSLIANPRIIAGAGDVLRAFWLGEQAGLGGKDEIRAVAKILLEAQSPTGGIPTGAGFARRGSSKAYQGKSDFRDVLPVVGWCDKAFRALALFAVPTNRVDGIPGSKEVSIPCTWKGKTCLFTETILQFSLYMQNNQKPLFLWEKGQLFPTIYAL